MLATLLATCAPVTPAPSAALAEVRGTWLTTTANDALATPAHTERTMQRLREIGLNTVYVEAWKNGYTQYPSQVLARTIGVAQRPAGEPQDPGDSAAQRNAPPRDLLGEAVTQAHRQGLIAVAWFEYGFMAAHGSTMNRLRQLKPHWLSRDRAGSELASNGFVWMNPLHPEARQFLLDLVLEAVDRYDLDGVQLDDRIVWPYVTMGYDEHTRAVYAAEHGGRSPPDDAHDPSWMRWRATKVNEFARWFVQQVRARRPGLLISLSPAPHPWAWEHYLLDWPTWAAWPAEQRWDEIIPQVYRFSYPAFEKTWRDQIAALQAAGAYRPQELVAGIRIVGDGADSSWEQLRDSIELVRREGQGGHVLWYSRGVLDVHADALRAHYAAQGPARSPRFPTGWRPASRELQPMPGAPGAWSLAGVPAGRYRVIGRADADAPGAWQSLPDLQLPLQQDRAMAKPPVLQLPAHLQRVELLLDRRADMAQALACRRPPGCR